ncbi:hypothetical protein Gohar_005187, partial [Gossypium harknessii]|nr:hypothetical protein [Gossypium harknessii]
NGTWVLGYNRFLGTCSISDTELWGILDGLAITFDKGFVRMIIVSDSLEVVQAIQGDFTKPNINTMSSRRSRSRQSGSSRITDDQIIDL